MVKIRISPRQKTSSLKKRSPQKKVKSMQNKEISFKLKEDAAVKEYDPLKNLLDPDKMGAAIMQCLIDNNPEGVLEIIENYLYAVNKTQFLKAAHIPRSTTYNFLKRRNPTIKTLAKLMHTTYRL